MPENQDKGNYEPTGQQTISKRKDSDVGQASRGQREKSLICSAKTLRKRIKKNKTTECLEDN